jgi:hypothetical protein
VLDKNYKNTKNNEANTRETEICLPKYSSTSETYVSIEARKETTFSLSYVASP